MNKLLIMCEGSEYRVITDLMELYRKTLDEGSSINYLEFEQKLYEAVPSKNGDYHFCEYLAKAFYDEGRWEEVFTTLYGGANKYRYIQKDHT